MKRRRSARNTTIRASLFPFLAVLLCTMGVLIVLLVVIARQSRDQAQRAAAQIATDINLEDLAIERELLELRIEQLKQQRAQTEKDLAARRLELGHLEDHARRIARKIEELRDSLMALDKTRQSDDPRRLARQIEQLEAQIAQARNELKRLADENRKRRRSYAVVPYQGPNQTRRRPIYIECRGDAIILQPEGVELTEADFRGPLTSVNPLAAALRASREYYLERDAQSVEDHGEPYPLLLVRTDGIYAYYVARAALKSWGSQFGYELIENDWELEFPPPDDRLAEIQRSAIAEARALQRQLAMAAPRKFARGTRPVFRVAPQGGGLVRVDGGLRERHTPHGFAPPGRRSERHAPRGTSSHAGHARGGFGVLPGQAETGGRPAATLDELASVYGGATSNASPQRSALGGSGQSGRAGRSSHSAARPAGGSTSSSQPAAAERVPETTAYPHGAQANRSNAYAGTGRGGSSVERGGSSKQPRFGQAAASSPREVPSGGMPTRQGGSAGDQANGQPQGTPGGSHLASGSATPTSGGNGSSGTSQGSSGGSSGMPQTAGANLSSVGGRPSTAVAQSPPPESLANTRGTNWGLPGSTQGAIPLTRPIRIECRSDRLIFWSDDRRPRPVRSVELAGATVEAVDQLVSAVWEEMDSWGIAGRGLYWRPTLVFDVHPDAVWRYQELAALLADSGLDVRYRLLRQPTARSPQSQRRR